MEKACSVKASRHESPHRLLAILYRGDPKTVKANARQRAVDRKAVEESKNYDQAPLRNEQGHQPAQPSRKRGYVN